MISTVAMFAVLTTSCRSGPNLSDHFYPDDSTQRPPLQSMLKAPIVAVGSVLAVRTVGGVRRSARIPEMRIELLELMVRVENVLRGSISTPTVKVYYFMFSAHNQRLFGVCVYTPVLQERLVLFLKEESGVIRSVGDVNDYTLRVYSGSHEGLEPPVGASLGEAISWVLLTPGKDLQPKSFVTYLGPAFSVSADLCSESCALTLLRPLLESENVSVRDRAGEIIASLRR